MDELTVGMSDEELLSLYRDRYPNIGLETARAVVEVGSGPIPGGGHREGERHGGQVRKDAKGKAFPYKAAIAGK